VGRLHAAPLITSPFGLKSSEWLHLDYVSYRLLGNRAFYRWLTCDYRALFPQFPERTPLFRLFRTPQDWTHVFLAAPTLLGVIDTYGIEPIHRIREGRSPQSYKTVRTLRWADGIVCPSCQSTQVIKGGFDEREPTR